MILSMIVALDRKGVIGVDGDLPWQLPDDLRYFKRVTLGKPIIMGRKTFASIGRPLPKRHNIVLTRDLDFSAENVTITHSPRAALIAAGNAEEIMIIGGAEIYRLYLPSADRLYLTYIAGDVDGTIYFPKFDTAEWCEVAREVHDADDKHAYAFTWVTLERKPTLDATL